MPQPHYYYVPTLGQTNAELEALVKKAVAEAAHVHREIGIIELTGFALLLFTSAFGISMAIMRDDHRNPMSLL